MAFVEPVLIAIRMHEKRTHSVVARVRGDVSFAKDYIKRASYRLGIIRSLSLSLILSLSLSLSLPRPITVVVLDGKRGKQITQSFRSHVGKREKTM